MKLAYFNKVVYSITSNKLIISRLVLILNWPTVTAIKCLKCISVTLNSLNIKKMHLYN